MIDTVALQPIHNVFSFMSTYQLQDYSIFVDSILGGQNH